MLKRKFKIRDAKEVVEVDGIIVEVYGWLKTFAHRRLDTQPIGGHLWRICELTTGLLLAGGDTKKKATDTARAVLDFKGKDLTLKLIAEAEKINKDEPVSVHQKTTKVIHNIPIDNKPEQSKLDI